MIERFSRGVAMVETALTIGVALLLVLGAAQMALIGYTQVSADGAAFLNAHTRAANPSANGQSVASSVFNQFGTGDFSTPSPGPVLDTSVVSKTVGGFSLVPGVASSYGIAGKDVEYAPANVSATPAPYMFSVTNTYIKNYCDPRGSCTLSNWQVYLAQDTNSGNNGNGVNGQFGEWRCHQKYFANIAHDFPTVYPGANYNSFIKGTALDVNQPNSDEGNVYSWDPGNGSHKCN
jgi:hypothetical protein